MNRAKDRTPAEKILYYETYFRILAEEGPQTTDNLHAKVCSKGLTKVGRDTVEKDQILFETEGLVSGSGYPREWAIVVPLDQALKAVRVIGQRPRKASRKARKASKAKGDSIVIREEEIRILEEVPYDGVVTSPDVVKKLHPVKPSKAQREKVFKTLSKFHMAGYVNRSEDRPFKYTRVKGKPLQAVSSTKAAAVERITPAVSGTSKAPQKAAVEDTLNEARAWRKVLEKASAEGDEKTEAAAKKALVMLMEASP